MTLEELKEEKIRLVGEQKKLIKERDELINTKENTYVSTQDSLALAVEAALELKTITDNAFKALCAGAVVEHNKAYGEDELTVHIDNMDKISSKLNSIVEYCEQQIKDLDAKITEKQKDISRLDSKIREYEGYISDELDRMSAGLKTKEQDSTTSSSSGSTSSNTNISNSASSSSIYSNAMQSKMDRIMESYR